MKQRKHFPSLIALAGIALSSSSHGQLLLSDDFESYTVGDEMNASGPWLTVASQEASLIVLDETTATPFGPSNQYLDFNDFSDPGNPSLTVRSENITAAPGAVTTFSFDFNEPSTGGAGTMIIGYANSNSDLNTTGRRLTMNLDDGAITGLSTNVNNTYDLDATYRIYVIFNDTDSAVNYNGDNNTVAPESADIWLAPSGGMAVFAGTRAAFNSSSSGYRIGLRSFSTNLQRVLIDNVTLEQGAQLPSGPPTLVSTTPADDASGVFTYGDLVATFNFPVIAGSGNITIKETIGDATFATFAATDPEVTFNGSSVTINPSSDLELSTEYYVLIDGDAIAGTTGGAFPEISDTTAWNFTTTNDGTPPSLSSTAPADDATGVAITANLVATFDEAIAIGSGNIIITNETESTIFATIDVTDETQVSIAGSTLTINPTGDLREGRSYSVEIESGSITDLASNVFSGLSGPTSWNFESIPDNTNPSLVSTNPSDNAVTISIIGNLVATFDEVIQAGSGNIVIRNATTNTDFATIPVGDPQVTISGNTLTIDPIGNLADHQVYAIQIDGSAVTDLSGNTFVGIFAPNVTTWNFETGLSAIQASTDSIRGRAQVNGGALGYLANVGSGGQVGIGGGNDARRDFNFVLGFTLPTLPVGETVSSATFEFEITQSRKQTSDPALHVYLLDTEDPDSSGTDLFFHGPSDPSTEVEFVGATNLMEPDTSSIIYDDDTQDQSLVLTGEALALLQSYYGGDNVPDRTEAFFRFNLDELLGGATLNNFERYFIDTTAGESLLTIGSVATSGAATYDNWAAGFTPNPGATDDNPDADTLDNLLEFAFGTDPNTSDDIPLVADGSVNGLPIAQLNGANFDFVFLRRNDHSTAGSITYTVQFSHDLQTFFDSTAIPTQGPTSAVDGDYRVVSVAYPVVLENGEKPRFARVKVEIVE